MLLHKQVFYADANGNFTVISPRAGATTQLIATVDQRNSAPVQIDIPSSGQEAALLAILRLIRNKGQFLVKQHRMQLF